MLQGNEKGNTYFLFKFRALLIELISSIFQVQNLYFNRHDEKLVSHNFIETPMMLLIFDIDGTLTDTKKVDDNCFITAFQDEFKVVLTNTDWATFTNVTDIGLFNELYKSIFFHSPTISEELNFKNRFFNYLESELKSNQDNFKAVNGASDFIEFCVSHKDYKIAYATGGWKNSAVIKLNAANIFHQDIPLCSCDSFIRRQDILLKAIEQSKQHYQVSDFNNIFYFGDGEWDFKTTKELQIPFVGVNTEGNKKLENLGTGKIIKDFTDLPKILHLLN